MKKNIALLIVYVGMPLVVFGSIGDTPDPCPAEAFKNLGTLLGWASCTLVRTVVPLLFSLATVAFIWGIIQYFLNPENEEKRKNGKSFMIWGIIALFVMVSMWGLVGVLSNTFGVKTLLPQLSQ